MFVTIRALPAPNGEGTLARREPIGTNTFSHWAALGDSFSAGPGAGNVVDGNNNCFRSDQSYPWYMSRSPSLPTQANGGDPTQFFSFQSCSGAETTDVAANQLSAVTAGTTFTTLSVGGNDIDFGKISKRCVFNFFGPCSDAIDRARQTMLSQTFFTNYNSLISRILLNMGKRTAVQSQNTLIFATAYPFFFNEVTTQCNSVSFAPHGGNELTQEFRGALNQLAGELNYYLAYLLDNQDSDINGQSLPYVSRAYMVDQNFRYAKHRFCEANVKEPSRNNEQSWFFNLLSRQSLVSASNFTGIDTSTCEQTTDAGSTEGDLAWYNCGLAIAYETQSNPVITDVPEEETDAALLKTFHPTGPGHTATGDEVLFWLNPQNEDGPRGKHLRIMCVGDSITHGYKSSDENGYRKELYDTLTANGNLVEYVGSRKNGYPPYDMNEGHDSFTIPLLLSSLKSSNILSQTQPNLVLLQIGTNDVNQADYNVDVSFGQLTDLITFIQQQVRNVAIIVANIPPQGLPTDPFAAPTSAMTKVIQWNGMTSRVVSNFQSNYNGHQAVWSVHTRTIFSDHATGDSLHLDDYGYDKLAFDWLRAIGQMVQINPDSITDPLPAQAASSAVQECANKPNWILNGEIANGGGLGRNAYPSILCTP